MSACPDWTALAAHRRERDGAEPAAWSEALAHLDDCPACRRAAPAADPTLLFRRLARVEAPLDERAEVEAVLQGVTALRAARRVAQRSGRGRSWARWAAAAVLAFLALSMDNEGLSRALHTAGNRPLAAAAVPAAPGRLPLLDGIEGPAARAGARIYQLEGEDLSVVMIVDESLDV
ncbi:MAG TPA: hypothetical protein VNJ70_16560 [Thermoanaerobaculia bacterium]|nr:hypothetical protein [Thermoanaerobaculia bacterium]